VLPRPAAPAPPAASAAAKAAAALASRKSDPAIGGRLDPARCPHRPVAAAASSLVRPQSAVSELLEPDVPIPPVHPCQSSVLQTLSPAPVVLAGLSDDLVGGDTSIQEATRCCKIAVDGDVDGRYAQLLHSGEIPLQCMDLATGSWASLNDDDDSDEEQLAPMTPPATNSSSLVAQRAQASVRREAEVSGGWQEVLHRRHPCRLVSPAIALPPRPIPAWLHGRCYRCLAHGHLFGAPAVWRMATLHANAAILSVHSAL
jgi:hypothetical protein